MSPTLIVLGQTAVSVLLKISLTKCTKKIQMITYVTDQEPYKRSCTLQSSLDVSSKCHIPRIMDIPLAAVVTFIGHQGPQTLVLLDYCFCGQFKSEDQWSMKIKYCTTDDLVACIMNNAGLIKNVKKISEVLHLLF